MKKWSIILREITITLLMIFIISFGLNYIRKPDIDSRLPDIKLKSIDNREITLLKKGEPLILHFWATWCPTCKLEASNIQNLKDSGIRVVTVAVNSGSSQAIDKFLKDRGYNYIVINDYNGELAKRFNVTAFPTTFIYNSSGELEFSEVGYSTTVGLKARVKLIE